MEKQSPRVYKIKKKELFLLFACLLLGFALRFYTFEQRSLWMDEIYTFNDSRDGLSDQIKFYKENPTYLHPPLFFVLTHLFYPFTNPERDLRTLPLIFGVLSIPMIYLLARLFSPAIALTCAFSLTFTVYHISLSQDGRSYSLLMFIGMAGLYFFMKHLQTLRRTYLVLGALFFAVLFHVSYSAMPFILFSQTLWFYQIEGTSCKPSLSDFFLFNGLLLLFCLPWTAFVMVNYHGGPLSTSGHTEGTGSFVRILYNLFQDWLPHLPLVIISVTILALFPFVSMQRRNPILLLLALLLPVTVVYLFCKALNVTHFVTSRYFVDFLPLLFITLFLSLDAIETSSKRLRDRFRPKTLFVLLLLASNFAYLPFYYHSEKQNLRGLVAYLKNQMRPGDKIYTETTGYIPGILHYFGVHPAGRHQKAEIQKGSDQHMTYTKMLPFQGREVTIYHSKDCCSQYVADGSRLWIVVGPWGAKNLRKNSPCVLKGFFDGSFLNFSKFPDDASIYLFLWDPKSPEEKGIDMPIE